MRRYLWIFLCLALVVLYPRIHRFWYNRRPAAVTFSEAATHVGEVKEWMRARVETELEPLKERPDFDAIMALDLPLVRVDIKANQLKCTPDLTGNVRYDAIKLGLEHLLALTSINDCTFALCLGDTVEWSRDAIAPPIFVFGRDRRARGLILFPDFSCFADRCGQYAWITHLAPEIRRANRKIPWEKKRAIAIWRGAATGLQQAPRIQLTELSKQYPKQIDAGFTHFGEASNTHMIRKNFLSPTDQMRYKYLVCVDGNTTTYPGLHWRLLSNSLVFKHHSENIQWYYGALQPLTHYIPIANDCSDLNLHIAWAIRNDSQAQEIAIAGTKFAEENLSLPAIFAYTALLLNVYAEKIQK